MDATSDETISRLLEMGFELPVIKEAMELAGSSFDSILEFILIASSNRIRKNTLSSSCKGHSSIRQTNLPEYLQQSRRQPPGSDIVRPMSCPVPEDQFSDFAGAIQADEPTHFSEMEYMDPLSHWEQRVNALLQWQFGFPSLKSFQKEALSEWAEHRDCLVISATGSGKSLCFQIPTLLTGKVVVVISPLISLMHDQCLKLAKHGVAACFLGSGQLDKTVEAKAMKGCYDIVYVCPESLSRIIDSLQCLARNRGIALFAIDEVHCISKWGHDFRPDYRRLCSLRQNFSTKNLTFLKYDIPLMALTATATMRVRKDIVESLHMSADVKIVLTSFFRPNLRFSVKHSRTNSSCYATDFKELVDEYVGKRATHKHNTTEFNFMNESSSDGSESEGDEEMDGVSTKEKTALSTSLEEMSVEYLENDIDIYDDWGVGCGEFYTQTPDFNLDSIVSPVQSKDEMKPSFCGKSLQQGPTIIYVPTRKETVMVANYLCQCGISAAAYHAKLPKLHLRRVHMDFHENSLQIVVATIAFGMGIDKANVRRIIHYGWPQSLEAYYQEAGRAGRDGKLSDCVLYVNMSRIPTLLPNKRSDEQLKLANKMLSDCFRYGMNTSICRVKTLVEYFGEDFGHKKCLMCDVCIKGPPDIRDLCKDAIALVQMVIVQNSMYEELMQGSEHGHINFIRRPLLKMVVKQIKEQNSEYEETHLQWWRGLARLLEDKGYIRNVDDKGSVQIRLIEPTRAGLKFMAAGEDFYVYPEADMLLDLPKKPKNRYSSFREWGKGWADPNIRRQRLATWRKRKGPLTPDTSRGRLMAKISKRK